MLSEAMHPCFSLKINAEILRWAQNENGKNHFSAVGSRDYSD
jgi:hypothetical protein